jgi:hypothetical protein
MQRSRGALGADGEHCCGKSQVSTKNLGVSNPADGPGINQEIRLDSSTQGEIAERKLGAAAGAALVSVNGIGQVKSGWRSKSHHRNRSAEQIGAKSVFRGLRGLDGR